MSNYTEHYNLKKPLKTESYDVDVANTNNDIIDEKLYEKVDKIPNKGLSTNDFTDGYKKKIDNFIEHEKGDSAYQIAVKKGFEGTEEEWLASLKGDKGDTPKKGTDYFTEEEIQKIKSNILDQVNQFSVLVVKELPTDNIDDHTIYFIPKAKTEQNDIYDEFIYINNGWEHIGTTEVDLSSYYKKDEIDAKLEAVEGNEVYIGNPAEAPNSAKIIVEEDDFVEGSTLGKAEVYVGAEEPTTGEKVWFRKGKNYLDISKVKSRTTYGITFTPTDTGIKISGTAEDTYAYGGSIGIDLKKGKTYTLYGNNAGSTLKLELKKGTTIIATVKTSNNKITFTPNDDVNLVTFILEGIVKGTTYNYEISNLQIEPGSKAAPYEHYIEQKLFVRNSNGVYEEFTKKSEEVYSTEETKIGTWIDGKPLYEKVIVQKDMSISNAVTINTNILNKDELVECNGLFRDGSNKIDIPYPLVSDDGKILQMYVSKDGTQIGFRGNLTYSRNINRFHIFILKYTKTTD